MFWSVLTGIVIGSAATGAAGWWIVRRQRARARSAEKRARASQRLAEIGQMTGGLAHEIRNPLSTIGMNAQLLAEGIEELPEDSEPRGRLLRRAGVLRREVERLGGILSDFLNYAGELRLDRRPADLNQIVSELADFFSPQAQQQGVRLRADLSHEPLPVEIDSGHVKQAVLNLMLNAVQAMNQPASPSSSFNSSAAAGPSAPSPSSAPKELILKTQSILDKREPIVRLHVIDTGPGIPADTLARIFDPYFTTKAGGTGLGLPTTRRLIEAHGGSIDVRTDPGRGTDFTITLPMASEPQANGQLDPSTASEAAAPAR